MARNLLVLILAAAFACSDYVGRYFGGTYDGNGSYTATVSGSPSGLVGAAPIHAIIDDNGYDDSKGTMTIQVAQGCSVAADYDSVTTVHGTVTSATATVAPGQTCQLPVDGGSAVFTISSGHATITGAETLDLTLGGALTSWEGATKQGYLSFTFRGAVSG